MVSNFFPPKHKLVGFLTGNRIFLSIFPLGKCLITQLPFQYATHIPPSESVQMPSGKPLSFGVLIKTFLLDSFPDVILNL